MYDIFKNKKVAIIGPAEYMNIINLNSHKFELSNADVIVKINCGFNISKKYESIFGKRCDVLYNNLLDENKNGGILNVKDLIDNKVKYIRTKPNSTIEGFASKTEKTLKPSTIKKIKQFQDSNIDVSIISHDFFNSVSNKIKCRPTMGFIAVLDILKHEPSSLYIAGFSFYLGGNVKEYWGDKKTLKDLYNTTEEEEANKCFNSKRHIHKNMWEMFKKEIKDNKVCKFDSVLNKILLMDSYSKERYEEILKEVNFD